MSVLVEAKSQGGSIGSSEPARHPTSRPPTWPAKLTPGKKDMPTPMHRINHRARRTRTLRPKRTPSGRWSSTRAQASRPKTPPDAEAGSRAWAAHARERDGNASGYNRDEVDREQSRRADTPLDDAADPPEQGQIEPQVQVVEVKQGIGDEPPVLVIERAPVWKSPHAQERCFITDRAPGDLEGERRYQGRDDREGCGSLQSSSVPIPTFARPPASGSGGCGRLQGPALSVPCVDPPYHAPARRAEPTPS